MPPWSVRLDPFNWLLEGRLGLELEAGLLSFMTVELVPVFVVNDSPPTLHYFSGYGDSLTQESNGVGALSGVSIGAGFWLEGKPLRGTVLRALFQNYGYTYETAESDGTPIDSMSHTDRVLMGMLGSVNRWGAFTIATGIGLGVDLNDEERCYLDGDAPGSPTGKGCGDIQLRGRGTDLLGVTSFLYPAVLTGRISLGVTID
jgi:hypothetical protein